MKLPRLAIANHQFTIIALALMLLIGVSAFLTMPRSEDPQFKLPINLVIAVYPGANPGDIEKLVADPIEEALNEIEDIKKLKTAIQDGLMVSRIDFYVGTDPDEKFDELNDKINAIRSELPEALHDLTVFQPTPSDVQILQIALISQSAPYWSLQTTAEALEKKLQRTPGVRKVETLAYPEREVRVSMDMEKSAALGISLERVIGSIQSENANIPGGSVDFGDKRFNIETSGDYSTLDDIRQSIVHAMDGKVVYLQDIATVDFAEERDAYFARVNGQRAIFVSVVQQEGTNIFDVLDDVKAGVREFKNGLEPGIKMHIVFDQSESVSKRLNGFFLNLLQGVFLVGIIVLFALGLRASVLVMLAIPFSITIAIGFVDFSGFALQQMTIVGLVISLGLLVDNAIVVIENVTRFMRQGKPFREAAVEGTGQIAWPIVSSTLTTVMAFVPLVSMQSTSGSFIRSMPVTVIFTLLASLLISLTLTPYLASKFLRPAQTGRSPWLQQRLDGLAKGLYQRSLRYALANPLKTVLITTVVFLSSLALFPLVGVSLFPKADKPQFIVDIDAPEGSSLQRTDEIAKHVESLLSGIPQVKEYTSNIGRDNPQIYYNLRPRSEKTTRGQIYVNLKPEAVRQLPAITQALRDSLRHYPGALIQVKEFEQGPPVDAPLSFMIIGDDLKILQDLALQLEETMQSTLGTTDVENPLRTPRTNLHIDINREKASLFGVRTIDVDRNVRAAMTGLTVSSFKAEDGERHDIVVGLATDKSRLSDFSRIFVSSQGGTQVPLRNLANITFRSGPNQILHYNMERAVQVNAAVKQGFEVEAVAAEIIKKLENFDLPPGYRFYVGGNVESRKEAFGGVMTAILIAVISIFGILVLQFRSYLQPLVVFSAIPVAIVGSILALLITGYTFSFTAFVGLTSLVGIVINNSIILVDYTNQLRRQGKDLISAITEAGQTRLTPIVLTTATTVGGLLPLTLGGGTIWAPMGWTIIGGLIVSTFLTLIVVPVLYQFFGKRMI